MAKMSPNWASQQIGCLASGGIDMKTPISSNESPRFKGSLRHYHRSGAKAEKSWDEWVDGKPAKSGSSLKHLKLLALMFATLALAGIVTGLIIELR